MGICLSCLRGEDYEGEGNEESSLLRNQSFYYNDNLQEELLLKEQQRQQELNGIVNDLSGSLIDVTSFLSNSSRLGTPNMNYSMTASSSDFDKTSPTTLGKEEKLRILKDLEDLDESVKQKCKVNSSGTLFLEF